MGILSVGVLFYIDFRPCLCGCFCRVNASAGGSLKKRLVFPRQSVQIAEISFIPRSCHAHGCQAPLSTRRTSAQAERLRASPGRCERQAQAAALTDPVRSAVELAVRHLIDLTPEQQSGRRAMLDWLRLEFGVEKPSRKLQDVAQLDVDTVAAEVKKARGKKNPLTVADVKRLKQEHTATVTPLQTLEGEALNLEQKVSDLVNAAYGLTPEEVKLMWDTAPPRMPLAGAPVVT